MSQPSAVVSKGANTAGSGVPRLKVMIIDPNPTFRDRLKDLVRNLRFVSGVSDRSSPHAILEVLAQTPVNVLMIDRQPGAGDALQIVRAIRGKPVGAHLGIVLLGDDLDEELRRAGREAGVAAFLQRPYDLGSVEAALVVAAQQAQEAVQTEPDKHREALLDMLHRLRKVSIFAGFSDPELVRLLKICRMRRYAAGNHIFREGEVARSMYVLVAGTVEIQMHTNGSTQVLVKMGAGDCFGEMAIVDASPRSADAVTTSDCIAFEVAESVVNNNEDLLSLKLVRQIAILLANKLRKQTSSSAP